MKILMSREESSMVSTWDVHLCLETAGGTLQLSNRQYEGLASVHDYEVESEEGDVEYDLPDEIDGKAVVGISDDMVVGGELVYFDEDDSIELSVGELKAARGWLNQHRWDFRAGFRAAWRDIKEEMARLPNAAFPDRLKELVRLINESCPDWELCDRPLREEWFKKLQDKFGVTGYWSKAVDGPVDFNPRWLEYKETSRRINVRAPTALSQWCREFHDSSIAIDPLVEQLACLQARARHIRMKLVTTVAGMRYCGTITSATVRVGCKQVEGTVECDIRPADCTWSSAVDRTFGPMWDSPNDRRIRRGEAPRKNSARGQDATAASDRSAPGRERRPLDAQVTKLRIKLFKPPNGHASDEDDYPAEILRQGSTLSYRARGVTVPITESEAAEVITNPFLYYFSTALKLHKRIDAAHRSQDNPSATEDDAS